WWSAGRAGAARGMDAAVVWSEPFPEMAAQAPAPPIRASRANAPIVLEVRLIGDSSLVCLQAERAGFEPARELAPPTRLAGECLQPLGHLSGRLRDCMRRSVALPIGIVVAFLIVALVATQLILPPVAARQIEHRLTKEGGTAH